MAFCVPAKLTQAASRWPTDRRRRTSETRSRASPSTSPPRSPASSTACAPPETAPANRPAITGLPAVSRVRSTPGIPQAAGGTRHPRRCGRPRGGSAAHFRRQPHGCLTDIASDIRFFQTEGADFLPDDSAFTRMRRCSRHWRFSPVSDRRPAACSAFDRFCCPCQSVASATTPVSASSLPCSASA